MQRRYSQDPRIFSLHGVETKTVSVEVVSIGADGTESMRKHFTKGVSLDVPRADGMKSTTQRVARQQSRGTAVDRRMLAILESMNRTDQGVGSEAEQAKLVWGLFVLTINA